MSNTVPFKNMMGVSAGDEQNMLGKLLYFSLPSVLVEKDRLAELCESMGFDYSGSKRLSAGDAFKSATGDIRDRVTVKDALGTQQLYDIYCRDNRRSDGILYRELVKETKNRETNQYQKLANISYDKDSNFFWYDNLAYDADVDPLKYCQQAEELFELYRCCANRKQIETICVNFLRSLEATKLNINGYLYFVPRHNMARVDIFEDFIGAINDLNRAKTSLTANSIYVINDEKQREKMTEEFYTALKKEIAEYQERADYFIKSQSQSPSIMERWVLKISALEEKKRHYESVLNRELDDLHEEFEMLKLLSQELSIRSQSLRFRRAA